MRIWSYIYMYFAQYKYWIIIIIVIIIIIIVVGTKINRLDELKGYFSGKSHII